MIVSSDNDIAPRVAIVIPNWNGLLWLEDCLTCLRKQRFQDFKIVIVDNGSVDGSIEFLAEHFPEVEVIELGQNTGFAHATNVGIDCTDSLYVALLNNDTKADPNWLMALADALDKAPPDVAGIASRMVQMDRPDLMDDAGDVLSWYGSATKRGHGKPASDFSNPCEVFSPCAGAALYRRSVLKQLNGFDECFFAYLEDVDLGFRARIAGHRFLYSPAALVQHKGHGSSLPSATYVKLITCNRFLLMFGVVPGRLLLKHMFRIAYGQFYFFAAYRKPIASLKGYARFLRFFLTGEISRRRKNSKEMRQLSNQEIDQILSLERPGPPIKAALVRNITKLFQQ